MPPTLAVRAFNKWLKDLSLSGSKRKVLTDNIAKREEWWANQPAEALETTERLALCVKTRERRGSSFSQLGLEPNHTGLTAQSLFFLEESCRVKRSDTQTFSNFSKLLQKSSQASKTFFQLLQIKRLQLKLTNNLQNSYQISSQHQVPKTWVKQHPKTPKTTKTNENPSPSSSMHKLVPFGSKLVPTWFL